MNDELELEGRLRDAFRRGPLPYAPASLRASLAAVPDAPVVAGSRVRAGRGGGGTAWRALAVAAVLLVGGVVALSVGGPSPRPLPVASPSAAPSAASGEPETVVILRPQWTSEYPFAADELTAIAMIVQWRIDATDAMGVVVAADDDGNVAIHIPAGENVDIIRHVASLRGIGAIVPLGSASIQVGEAIDSAKFPALMEGLIVDDAEVVDDAAGQPALQLTLDQGGTTLFAEYSAANVGSSFAITIDGQVLAAPVIQTSIPDGIIQITSSALDRPSLELAAALLRLGPLPVALVEIGSEPAPSPSPSEAVDPIITCEPRLEVEGPQLECGDAIDDALTLLPADHPLIAEIRFVHTCHDVITGTVADCAVQLSGTVTVSYFNGSSVRIAVSAGSPPTILPELPTP